MSGKIQYKKDDIIWFGEQKNIKTNIRVVILSKFIKVNKFCINKYFEKAIGAQVAYLEERKQLLIRPANEDYYRFWSKYDLNYKYLIVPKFINMYNFIISKKEYLKYTYSWDNKNKYLIVNNVCIEREKRI